MRIMKIRIYKVETEHAWMKFLTDIPVKFHERVCVHCWRRERYVRQVHRWLKVN